MKPRVDILLATYNGERYLPELLKSLLNQSYRNMRVLIRDDGSKDGTPDVIRDYAERFPDILEVIEDQRGNLGVTNNMFCLLGYSDADYVMFCDQDDLWMSDKVETLVRAIRRKEKQFPGRPVLVHADSITVDGDLQPVSKDARKSLTSYQTGRDKRKNSFVQLLFCNTAQGASMIFNRPCQELLDRLCECMIPNAVIYDSLVSSICSIGGHVFYLARPLMYYRQHGKNLVGAKKRSLFLYPLYDEAGKDEVLTAHFLQYNKKKSDLLLRFYKAELSKWQQAVMKHFSARPGDWQEYRALGLHKEFTAGDFLTMRFFGIR